MRFSVILACFAAFALASCDTIYGPARPMQPIAAGTLALTTATKAPFGTYVVDGSGRSVYILDGTRGGSGINRCSGPCLGVWPPLSGTAGRNIATGLNPGLVQTVSGFSGGQLAYGGWPLYFYARDTMPSDTTGQGVRDQWGTWYLLSPSGEPIRPRY